MLYVSGRCLFCVDVFNFFGRSFKNVFLLKGFSVDGFLVLFLLFFPPDGISVFVVVIFC